MATRSWEFRDDLGHRHLVTFDHGRLSRWQTVTLDGTEVVRVRRWLDARGTHAFTVDGRPAQVRVSMDGVGYSYDLVIDGQHVAEAGTTLAPAGTSSVTTAATQDAWLAEQQGRRGSRSGSSWLYWIAAATLVNAVLYHVGVDLVFPIGVLFGFFLEGVFSDLGPAAGVLAQLLVASAFFVIAQRARAGSPRALMTGLILYTLDAVIAAFILLDLLFVILHIVAITGLFRAWNTARAARSAQAPA